MRIGSDSILSDLVFFFCFLFFFREREVEIHPNFVFLGALKMITYILSNLAYFSEIALRATQWVSFYGLMKDLR